MTQDYGARTIQLEWPWTILDFVLCFCFIYIAVFWGEIVWSWVHTLFVPCTCVWRKWVPLYNTHTHIHTYEAVVSISELFFVTAEGHVLCYNVSVHTYIRIYTHTMASHLVITVSYRARVQGLFKETEFRLSVCSTSGTSLCWPVCCVDSSPCWLIPLFNKPRSVDTDKPRSELTRV